MKKHFPGITKIFSVKDLTAKIICIVLSVILWAYISSINIGEIKFKIPVTFTNLPETLIKSKISDRYVTVSLTGRKDNIKNVNVKSIKAIVNLEQPEIGINRSYPIEILKEEIPENIDINLSIKEVTLTIERKISKKVAVRANIIDKVMNGYVLGRIKITPDTITISGPESLVRTIDFLQTEKISIANVKERSIEKIISIDKKYLPDITTDISKVRIVIPIINSDNLFAFRKKIILKYNNDKYNYSLNQEEVTVYLRPDKPETGVSEKDIGVYIDIDAADLDDFFKEGRNNYIENNYPVNPVIMKEGIKVVSILPDIVTVKISKK